jgi:L-threonylcarbamoyladenylate synthase
MSNSGSISISPIPSRRSAEPRASSTLKQVTERLPVTPASLARAAELLRAGRLVAFPTETVYGLGARADSEAAARSIFAAKGRPPGNPLIVHVPSIEAARALAEGWSDAAEALAQAFWPGPLTLVVRRRAGAIADAVTASGPTVALRVPEHPVARALLEAAGLPIAAPSANRSTAISPTTADHVMKSLGGRIDAVLDGGPTGHGIESSIADVSRAPVALLRHGAIPLAAIAALVPVVDEASAVAAPGAIARAPGGQARHYAPRARVILVPPEAVAAEVDRRRAQGDRVGALERGEGTVSGSERLPDDPARYAAGLYAALHRLEDAGSAVLVIAEPPASPAWAAVRDRLRRASA